MQTRFMRSKHLKLIQCPCCYFLPKYRPFTFLPYLFVDEPLILSLPFPNHLLKFAARASLTCSGSSIVHAGLTDSMLSSFTKDSWAVSTEESRPPRTGSPRSLRNCCLQALPSFVSFLTFFCPLPCLKTLVFAISALQFTG